MYIMDKHLWGIQRCPHCSVYQPEFRLRNQLDFIPEVLSSAYGRPKGWHWGTFMCSGCNNLILAKSDFSPKEPESVMLEVAELFPAPQAVDSNLPERVFKYLTQALESIHVPDGAVMLAGSAVDAMLKEKGLVEGSLYKRIDMAVEQNLLTEEMGEWAHSVRLGSDRPRHADTDAPHVTPEEAKQSCEFAKTLGMILFTLPQRIEAGKRVAQKAI
ncbi:MAG TPA: DUF4145 domain-containing protein [Henriciella marina]|nr:DUF4145 domain-containing protein [Henriciella marina]